MGIDHLRAWAGLSPIHLEETWAPALTTAAASWGPALSPYMPEAEIGSFAISATSAGTAFLFGAGIYCGTYVLGTNFIYRLMFLLLCIPQLQDWQTRRARESINWKRRAGTLRNCCRRALVEWEFEWPFGIGFPRASSDAQLDLVLLYELRAYVSIFAQLGFRR